MKKNVKALLLNSTSGKVESIEFDGNYNSIHQILGKKVESIDWVTFPNGDILYYDFEQDTNYTKKDKGFQFSNGLCLYGNGLLVGNKSKKNDGHNWFGTNVNFPIEVIKEVVTFGKLVRVNQVES